MFKLSVILVMIMMVMKIVMMMKMLLLVVVVIKCWSGSNYKRGPVWLSCGSSGFIVEVTLDKTLHSPSLVWLKPRKATNYVGFRVETEILSKAVKNNTLSINKIKLKVF